MQVFLSGLVSRRLNYACGIDHHDMSGIMREQQANINTYLQTEGKKYFLFI